MKLIEENEKIVVLNDNGDVLNPQDPVVVDYLINKYNSLLRDVRRAEIELKTLVLSLWTS